MGSGFAMHRHFTAEPLSLQMGKFVEECSLITESELNNVVG